MYNVDNSMMSSTKYIDLLLLAFFIILFALVLILSKVYNNYEAKQLELEKQTYQLDSM